MTGATAWCVMLLCRCLAALLLLSEGSGRWQQLVFEKNKKEAPEDVLYLLQGPGYRLDFKRGEVGLQLTSQSLRFHFAGPVRKGTPEGHARLDGLIRYINQPENSHEIPTFASLHYDSLYSGIDLVLYGRRSQLKAELLVAPNADLGQVRIQIQQADRIALDDSGSLTIAVAGESFQIRRPIAIQMTGGERRDIEMAYEVTNSNEVRFTAGDFDPALPLTIQIPW